MSRFFLGLLLLVACFFTGCDQAPVLGDDLAAARQAVAGNNWLLAERLLERFLAAETDSDKRWQAWQQLLVVINSGVREPRATLEYLEAMLVEYADDDKRCKLVLEHTGQLLEQLRQFDRAADVWSTYLGLGGLNPDELVKGYRHLAAMEFARRRPDAGEEALAQCLAQPFEDSGQSSEQNAKIHCMYDLADHYSAAERWKDVSDICYQILESLPAEKPEGEINSKKEATASQVSVNEVSAKGDHHANGLNEDHKLDVPGNDQGSMESSRIRGMTSYLLADSLEQQGRNKEALAIFEQARQIYPNRLVIDNRIDSLKKKTKRK